MDAIIMDNGQEVGQYQHHTIQLIIYQLQI